MILTMQSDPGFARRSLELGATSFVLKDAADTDLVEAVRHAAIGEAYTTSKLAEAASAPRAGERTDKLTPRELEVLRLIALGHTNTEIAGRLLLSVRTVESHRAHIQKKLGRSTRAELVRYALDHHLLDA